MPDRMAINVCAEFSVRSFFPFESFFPELHLSRLYQQWKESGGGIRYPCMRILSGYFMILNINRAAPSPLPLSLLPSCRCCPTSIALCISCLPWIFQSNFISGMATNERRSQTRRTTASRLDCDVQGEPSISRYTN